MDSPRKTSLLLHRPHLHDLPAIPPLPGGYVLRSFTGADDLADLSTTLSEAFNDPWPPERVRTELTEAPDVKAVYVVAWQGKPVATASSRYLPERFPHSGYVHWVGTHPLHARKGLSAALMAQVLQDFVERGYKDAVLETEDFRLPALRLYLKTGFLPVYEVRGEDHRKRWSAIFKALL
ncbi:MAG: hypothetical protein C4299_03930 [Thermoleophilia bacterium]